MNNAVLIDDAKQRVALLSASLPTVVDPASISYTAKTPFKLLEEFAGWHAISSRDQDRICNEDDERLHRECCRCLVSQGTRAESRARTRRDGLG